jgi:hypothetical protein
MSRWAKLADPRTSCPEIAGSALAIQGTQLTSPMGINGGLKPDPPKLIVRSKVSLEGWRA